MLSQLSEGSDRNQKGGGSRTNPFGRSQPFRWPSRLIQPHIPPS